MFNTKQAMYQTKAELFDSIFNVNDIWRIADNIPDSTTEYLLWAATISLFSVIVFRTLRVVARSFRATA